MWQLHLNFKALNTKNYWTFYTQNSNPVDDFGMKGKKIISFLQLKWNDLYLNILKEIYNKWFYEARSH